MSFFYADGFSTKILVVFTKFLDHPYSHYFQLYGWLIACLNFTYIFFCRFVLPFGLGVVYFSPHFMWLFACFCISDCSDWFTIFFKPHTVLFHFLIPFCHLSAPFYLCFKFYFPLVSILYYYYFSSLLPLKIIVLSFSIS